MTNLDKMKQLVGSEQATKEDIVQWAYMNRVLLADLPDEEEFTSMKNSVNQFFKSKMPATEHEAWEQFLDVEYVG